jgi:two-component system chemotaxis response regulator CheB
LQVVEAADKERLDPGTVYVAPPDYHLLIDGPELALSTDALVNYSRPSIDVLFESAADSFEHRTVGVILTGANADGAAGLAAIRRAGGLGIVQDPAGAERPEMPRAAIQTAGADRIVELSAVGPLLTDLCGAA